MYTDLLDKKNKTIEYKIYNILELLFKNSVMGEFRSTLPPWIARVSENATESVARWEGLKIETIGVAHIIKVGSVIKI